MQCKRHRNSIVYMILYKGKTWQGGALGLKKTAFDGKGALASRRQRRTFPLPFRRWGGGFAGSAATRRTTRCGCCSPHCTVRGTGCGLLNKGTQLIAYALDSEQVQRCVRLAKDINCNEYFAIPTSMAFEELEDLVEQYGD